jgi:hypothetical protein
MSHTRRSTYRRADHDGNQSRLDVWYAERRKKQARRDADAMDRTMQRLSIV